eukprot:scaffold17426_cov170-Amphora_coffeaeformis.AAC.6
MRLSLALATVASLFAQSQAQNLVDLVVATEDLATLEAAVIQADLVDTLSGEGPFTVFAPTNASFAALPAELLSKLLEDQWKAHLADVLTYHVAAGNVSSDMLSDGQTITMVNGEDVTIGIADGTVTINGNAEVVTADVYRSNGVAHVIDAVLTPAFIDRDIVQLAQAAATTLFDLVGAADLAEALSATDGAFTVFAPTNDAFAALPEETVTFLTSDEGKANLTAILTYHVIPSVIASGAIPEGTTTIESLEGTELTIVNTGGSITVNGAAVTSADNLANNGIVHIIDTVLTIPDPTEMPEDAASSVAFMAALASSLLLVFAL